MTQPIDFNRHTFPPGGWSYTQPQTGWRAPTPTSSTFNQTVQLIRQHRLGNPAMVSKHKLSTDVVSIENELEAYTRQRLGIKQAAPPPKTLPPSRPAGVVGDVAEAGRRIGVGIGILRAWFGDNCEPVEAEVAENRAAVCAECPKNQSGNLLQRLEGVAAEGLRMTIEAKKSLSLRTKQDEALHSCQACDCHLGLKVWVPSDFIMLKTPPDMMARLMGVRTNSGRQCWIVDAP